jgi:hypothetical protein
MFCGECGRSVASAASARTSLAPAAPVREGIELVEPGPSVRDEGRIVPELELESEVGREPEPLDVAPEPEPDVVPEPVSVSEPAAEPSPEPEPDVAPEPVPDPSSSPEPEPELRYESRADPASSSSQPESCAQCGTPLDPADIFCPECGFVRQSAANRPRDTVALDPFPWGTPVDATPVAPAAEFSTSPATPSSVGYDDIDDTRTVDRSRRGERFVLQFSTGESVSVSTAGLLGRNPMPEPGEYFDALVAISDPGKSVSKTHLEFGQDGGAFWISDRYSGNGTVVREPDARPRRCEPGKRYRIVRGTRVDIGEQFFVVS